MKSAMALLELPDPPSGGVAPGWSGDNKERGGEAGSSSPGVLAETRPPILATPAVGATEEEQGAKKAGRKKRPRLPRTNDKERGRQIARAVGEVIDTPEVRAWYAAMGCDGAPAFPHFWGYVLRSLTYDVPGGELCGLVWEATERAFRSFDPARGDAEIPVEGRFLTHWRSQLGNLAKKRLRVRPTVELPDDPPGDDADPLWGLMGRMLPGLVEGLPEEERRIIRLHYWEGETFEEVAKVLGRRKQTVLDNHHRIPSTLRRGL